MNVHDFWSGKTHIPPGLSPALPRHAAAGQCIPQRNRLTGAYQPPAAVWMEQQPIVAQPVEQRRPVKHQPATVGTVDRFQWLELREVEDDGTVTVNR